MMKGVDDSALLKRAWTGNEAAFAELCSRYQRRIFQYATRMCGPAAGDYVVQETCLAVLRRGSFDEFFSARVQHRGNEWCRLVRMEVSRDALAAFGPAAAGSASSPESSRILADVLVGDDGLAWAARFVEIAAARKE